MSINRENQTNNEPQSTIPNCWTKCKMLSKAKRTPLPCGHIYCIRLAVFLFLFQSSFLCTLTIIKYGLLSGPYHSKLKHGYGRFSIAFRKLCVNSIFCFIAFNLLFVEFIVSPTSDASGLTEWRSDWQKLEMPTRESARHFNGIKKFVFIRFIRALRMRWHRCPFHWRFIVLLFNLLSAADIFKNKHELFTLGFIDFVSVKFFKLDFKFVCRLIEINNEELKQ